MVVDGWRVLHKNGFAISVYENDCYIHSTSMWKQLENVDASTEPHAANWCHATNWCDAVLIWWHYQPVLKSSPLRTLSSILVSLVCIWKLSMCLILIVDQDCPQWIYWITLLIKPSSFQTTLCDVSKMILELRFRAAILDLDSKRDFFSNQ